MYTFYKSLFKISWFRLELISKFKRLKYVFFWLKEFIKEIFFFKFYLPYNEHKRINNGHSILFPATVLEPQGPSMYTLSMRKISSDIFLFRHPVSFQGEKHTYVRKAVKINVFFRLPRAPLPSIIPIKKKYFLHKTKLLSINSSFRPLSTHLGIKKKYIFFGPFFFGPPPHFYFFTRNAFSIYLISSSH